MSRGPSGRVATRGANCQRMVRNMGNEWLQWGTSMQVVAPIGVGAIPGRQRVKFGSATELSSGSQTNWRSHAWMDGWSP